MLYNNNNIIVVYMPYAIEASIKTKVIQQWLSVYSRPKIAIDNNIGEGTVGSIINYFKVGLDHQNLTQPGN
jgi:hypothetical protein